MSAWGTSMILAYEYLSMNSLHIMLSYYIFWVFFHDISVKSCLPVVVQLLGSSYFKCHIVSYSIGRKIDNFLLFGLLSIRIMEAYFYILMSDVCFLVLSERVCAKDE